MMRARTLSVRPFRGGLLAGLLLAGAAGTARAQLLKMGPIDLSMSSNASLEYGSNVNGVANGKSPSPGVEKDDLFLTYGFSLSGRTRLYPDIDLTLSTSLTREKHFIQDEEASDDIPLLGNANFGLSRQRGHYDFSLSLSHSADSEYNRQEVFRPTGTRKGRDITQNSRASVGAGWSIGAISIKSNYNYGMERHSDLFAEGDRNTQTILVSSGYRIHPRVSLNASHSRTNEEILNTEDDPASGVWQSTTSVDMSVQILSRPRLSYSVGMEQEDDLGEKGEWEPRHSVTMADNRALGTTVTAGYNASYNFERQEETDDVTFTYGANLNHRAPFRFTQGLTATREPVSTFGSTSKTDSTTLTYSLSHPSFFLPNLSMSTAVSYSLDKPAGDVAGGETEEMTYTFGLSRSYTLSRKWSASTSYFFTRSDRTLETPGQESEVVDEHRFTLSTSYLLF
jgi:hypothetical protein